MSSNFLEHLKPVHPTQYDQIFVREDEYSPEKNVIDDDRAAADATSTKYKQNRFTLSIAKNLIIRCNVPLNIVENCGFRDFLKECNLHMNRYRQKSEA